MTTNNTIDPLLSKYATGTLSENEGSKVDEWIGEEPGHRREAVSACMTEQTAARIFAADAVDAEGALRKVHAAQARSRRRNFAGAVQRVAALLALPLLLAGGWFAWQYFRTDANPTIELHTTSGMTSYTTLPDGSEVWLNSNSHLSYPTRFDKGREVVLDGEAFFKVTKQNGRKFTVHAGSTGLEVLGTEFNVEAYSARTSEVRATLLTGSVAFSCKDSEGNEHTVLMHPGEQYTYDSAAYRLSFAKVNGQSVAAWKDGKIVLDNTSLEDALRAIGNRFNVVFMVRNEALLGNRYTGTFDSQRLDVVLEHFRRTTKIHFDTDLKSADSENVSGPQIIIVY